MRASGRQICPLGGFSLSLAKLTLSPSLSTAPRRNQWPRDKKSSTEELPQPPCPQHVPAACCSKPSPVCLLGAIQRLLCSPPLLRAEQYRQPQSWAGNANLPDVLLRPPYSTTIKPKSCTRQVVGAELGRRKAREKGVYSSPCFLSLPNPLPGWALWGTRA